jgi:hypothetical protein
MIILSSLRICSKIKNIFDNPYETNMSCGQDCVVMGYEGYPDTCAETLFCVSRWLAPTQPPQIDRNGFYTVWVSFLVFITHLTGLLERQLFSLTKIKPKSHQIRPRLHVYAYMYQFTYTYQSYTRYILAPGVYEQSIIATCPSIFCIGNYLYFS